MSLRRDLPPQLERRGDRRLRVKLAQEILEVGARQLERTAVTAELAELERAEQFAHAVGAVDRLLRSGHARGGEQRGEHAVARGVSSGGALPHRQFAAARRVQRDVRGHRKRDRLRDPIAVEPEHFGRADRAADRGIEHVIEAMVAHAGGVKQRAVDFIAEHDAGNHGGAVRAGKIGRGQHRRSHVARMAAAAGKHVVAVEIARHHAVGERRKLRQGALFGAEHTGPARHAHALGERPRDAARRLVECAERASHGIEEVALALMHDVRRQVGKGQVGGVARDSACRGVHAAN